MTTTHEAQVRDLLQQWAAATRKGQRDDVLANHLPDVLIYDVLAPMNTRAPRCIDKAGMNGSPIRKVKGNSSCKIYL
jgi:ketosteroid isomerase-like protein